MLKSRRVVSIKVMVGTAAALAVFAMLVTAGNPFVATSMAQEEEAAEPAPPAGQEYIGAKRCSSCHFQEFMSWTKTPHAKVFDLLTDKYAKDEKCLKCHTTGFGAATGYKDGDKSLAGVTCEACHGPGSKHEEVAKPFAKTKDLAPADEKAIRDSIWKVQPKNVCIGCHTVQGHGKSETPADMKK